MPGGALQLGHAGYQQSMPHRIELLRLLRQHRLRDHQFADQIDQLVDLVDRHAQRAAFAGGRCRRSVARADTRGRWGRPVRAAICSVGPGRLARNLSFHAGLDPGREGHLVGTDMKREQIGQLGLGRGRDDLENPVPGWRQRAAIGRLDAAQRADVAEQLQHAVDRTGVLERAQRESQHPWAGQHRRGRRRRRAAAGQRLQARGQRRGIDRLVAAVAMTGKQATQRVTCLQQRIHHVGSQRELVPAQPVEQGFHLVRERGDVGKAEGRRPTLDRVRDAEHRIEVVVAGRRAVHRQQQRLH